MSKTDLLDLVGDEDMLHISRFWHPYLALQRHQALAALTCSRTDQTTIGNDLKAVTTPLDSVSELIRIVRLQPDLEYENSTIAHPRVMSSYALYGTMAERLKPATEPPEALFATMIRMGKQHGQSFPAFNPDGTPKMSVAKPGSPAKHMSETDVIEAEQLVNWAMETINQLKLCGLNAK
jgi:hypothetical protein